MDKLVGKIIVKEKGFGFIDLDETTSFFVPNENVKGAMNGDIVEFKVVSKARDGESATALVEKVVERSKKSLVVEVVMEKGKVAFIPDDKAIKHIVKIDGPVNLTEGYKILLDIVSIDDKEIVATVNKVIGHKNDPGSDILSIVYGFDVRTSFAKEAEDRAAAVEQEVDQKEAAKRKDLRKEIIITIDGEDAKDLDDAITVKKLPNGNYFLGVYIADVSHYVQEGDAIDVEAFERSTSIYLADRVIPMLPKLLSNGICSLNESVDRLVLGCEMEIDANGTVVNSELIEGVINTRHRMTYTAVNKMIHGDKETIEKYSDIAELVEDANKLSQIIRNNKLRKGMIDFDLDEPKILVDETGKAVGVVKRERFEAEKLIEDMMVVANETVAKMIKTADLPGIYRIHETPKERRLMDFLKFVKTLRPSATLNIGKVTPKDIQQVLDSLRDEPGFNIIATMMLRAMQKAVYSPDCLGHFGLALQYYTHFTSPIRRYPDLIVHRLVREFFIKNNRDQKTISHWNTAMPGIADQTSRMERIAVDCERAVNAMKMAEFAMEHIGQEFSGVITSITQFGFFVELESTMEGLVHVSNLLDDRYNYQEATMTMVGEKNRRTFKIGQKLNIYIIDASKEESRIDFGLVEFKGMKKSFRKGTEGVGAKRSFGDRPQRDGDRPRRDFGDKPRSFGDRPSRGGDRDRSDRPRRDFGDRPRSFGDRPSRDGDRPRRDFGDKPRSFGDRPSRDGDRPRRDFGDRPRRDFGDKPRSFGDRPSRGGDRDRSDRPRRDFGDRPRSFGDRPSRDGDRPRRDFGDKPRSFGDRPSRGGDRDWSDRPRRDFGDKPRSFGDRPSRGGDRDRSDRPRRDGERSDRPRSFGGDRKSTGGRRFDSGSRGRSSNNRGR